MITCFIILHYTFSLWSKIHEETYVLLKQIMYNGMIQIWDWCAALLPKEIDLVLGFFFRPGVVRASTFRSQQMCFISIQILVWCQKKLEEFLNYQLKSFQTRSTAVQGFLYNNSLKYNDLQWNLKYGENIHSLNNLFKKIKSLGLLYMYLFYKL